MRHSIAIAFRLFFV